MLSQASSHRLSDLLILVSSFYAYRRNVQKIKRAYHCRKSCAIRSCHSQCDNQNYLRLTSAPSASSLALISSASALEAPSLTTFGAPSTNSLASLSPRPVTSRTTLITLTLDAPADTSSTSNSSFSSAAAPPSAPAAATTTPAAADTPNSSSHALSYELFHTDMFFTSEKNFLSDEKECAFYFIGSSFEIKKSATVCTSQSNGTSTYLL